MAEIDPNLIKDALIGVRRVLPRTPANTEALTRLGKLIHELQQHDEDSFEDIADPNPEDHDDDCITFCDDPNGDCRADHACSTCADATSVI